MAGVAAGSVPAAGPEVPGTAVEQLKQHVCSAPRH